MAHTYVEVPNALDLMSILPADISTEEMFSNNYWEWEEKVAAPALEDIGYRVRRWWSPERDSFGPLSRAVDVYDKQGNPLTLIYA